MIEVLGWVVRYEPLYPTNKPWLHAYLDSEEYRTTCARTHARVLDSRDEAEAHAVRADIPRGYELGLMDAELDWLGDLAEGEFVIVRRRASPI